MLVNQDPNTGPFGGAWQALTGAQQVADSFILSQSATITEYDMFGVSAQANSYTLTLYADSGSNAPGATLLTLGSLTPSTFVVWGTYGGLTAHEARFTGLSIGVSAGTKYWIDVAGNGTDAGVFSTNPSSNGDGVVSYLYGGTWYTNNSIGDLTYRLQGDPVPEPASMIALAVGALALIRKRARK